MRMKKNGKAKTKANYSAGKTMRSKPAKYNSPPVLEAVENKEFEIGGEIGRMLSAVTEQ